MGSREGGGRSEGGSGAIRVAMSVRLSMCLSIPHASFHQLGPLGRVGLEVAKSVCLFVCLFVPIFIY